MKIPRKLKDFNVKLRKQKRSNAYGGTAAIHCGHWRRILVQRKRGMAWRSMPFRSAACLCRYWAAELRFNAGSGQRISALSCLWPTHSCSLLSGTSQRRHPGSVRAEAAWRSTHFSFSYSYSYSLSSLPAATYPPSSGNAVDRINGKKNNLQI